MNYRLYDSIESINKELLLCEKDGWYSIIDIFGKEYLKAEYDLVTYIGPYLLKVVNYDGLEGIFDIHLKKLIMPCEFYDFEYISNFVYKVRYKNKYGLYNVKLEKLVTEVRYDKIDEFSSGFICTSDNSMLVDIYSASDLFYSGNASEIVSLNDRLIKVVGESDTIINMENTEVVEIFEKGELVSFSSLKDIIVFYTSDGFGMIYYQDNYIACVDDVVLKYEIKGDILILNLKMTGTKVVSLSGRNLNVIDAFKIENSLVVTTNSEMEMFLSDNILVVDESNSYINFDTGYVYYISDGTMYEYNTFDLEVKVLGSYNSLIEPSESHFSNKEVIIVEKDGLYGLYDVIKRCEITPCVYKEIITDNKSVYKKGSEESEFEFDYYDHVEGANRPLEIYYKAVREDGSITVINSVSGEDMFDFDVTFISKAFTEYVVFSKDNKHLGIMEANCKNILLEDIYEAIVMSFYGDYLAIKGDIARVGHLPSGEYLEKRASDVKYVINEYMINFVDQFSEEIIFSETPIKYPVRKKVK